MLGDLLTMLYKERRDLPMRGGGRGASSAGFAGVVLVFGVFFPLAMKKTMLDSPVLVLFALLPAMILTISLVPDAFAGERERHTLETLLTTPLSDTAIFVGKVGTGVLYAWSVSIAVVLAAVVTVSMAGGVRGPWPMQRTMLCIAAVLLALLVSVLFGTLGVLLSERAATVRDAQQTLSAIVFALFAAPLVFAQLFPEQLRTLMRNLPQLQAIEVIYGTGAILVVVDVVLLAFGVMRFKRERLSEVR